MLFLTSINTVLVIEYVNCDVTLIYSTYNIIFISAVILEIIDREVLYSSEETMSESGDICIRGVHVNTGEIYQHVRYY